MTEHPQITLKATQRARVLQGHPWVFAGEIRSKPNPELDGESVVLKDARGRFLGVGLEDGNHLRASSLEGSKSGPK